MTVTMESVRGEVRRYGSSQVRVELVSVFVCDRREEALGLIRSVASLGDPPPARRR